MTVPALSSEPSASSRPLTGGVVIAAASRIAVTAAGVLTTIVLARVLGPHGWGSYVIAQALAMVLLVATTLGVEHGIAYFVSSGQWSARAAFVSSLKVAGGVGIAGAAIAIGSRVLVPSAFAGLPVWLTAVVAAGLPFGLAWFYTSSIAISTDRYEAGVALPAAQATLVLALAVPGAAVDGAEGAVIGMATATILTGVSAVVWGIRRFPRSPKAGPSMLGRAISFGVKGYAANALQIINYRLDLFILSAVAATASVGQYSLAVAATSLLWILPSAFSDVLFPRVARLSEGGDEISREAAETKSLRHTSMIVLSTAVLLALALELLVVPIFGSHFRPSVDLGLILLPGAAAIGLATVLSAVVVGRGKPSYSLYNSLVTVPITIVLYVALIPSFGATGAAVASTASYVLSLLIVCALYQRVAGQPVMHVLVPTAAEFKDFHVLLKALEKPPGRHMGRRLRKPEHDCGRLGFGPSGRHAAARRAQSAPGLLGTTKTGAAHDALVLLTAAYPFGHTWETFLEPELTVLARRFSEVIVLPSSTDDYVRPLPPGVRCDTRLANPSRARLAQELFWRPAPCLTQYLRGVFEEGSWPAYLRDPVTYLGVATLNRWRYRLLKEFVESHDLRDALFYDYWLANSTLALSILRRRGVVRRAVARAHEFDLYGEDQGLAPVPYQAFAMGSLDRVFPISAHGLSYLATRYPTARSKLLLSRLGVESRESAERREFGSEPLIVSCGSLTPRKRIDILPDLLARIGRPLRWVHFGDGPERWRVERAAGALPEWISWRLAGHVEHDAIIEYYANTNVDLFVSLSRSEGLPVSIMEAISFGIPVLATAVGGVPEIVTSSTGVLVEIDEPVDSVAERARALLDGDAPSPAEVVAFFKANFDATRNFNQFADLLLEV